MKYFIFSYFLLLNSYTFSQQNKGIVVGDSVILYENIDSRKVLVAFYNLEVFDILDDTTFKISKSENDCSKFSWVKVMSKSGQIGWVSSKDFYKISSLSKQESKVGYLKIDNVTYRLLICRNYGVRAMNVDGLTDCEDSNPIVLYNSKNDSYYLAQNDNFLFSEKMFLCLRDDNMMREKIVSKTSVINDVTLLIDTTFQEGYGKYEIHLKRVNEKIIAHYGELVRRDKR
jgi:hypothetical protein